MPPVPRNLQSHVDGSLEVVEGIISELLDIAKFDAGAMRSEMVPLQLDELLRELEREFAPHAAAKGLKLRVARSSAIVSTDRLLLRRLLQKSVVERHQIYERGRRARRCASTRRPRPPRGLG